MQTEFINFVVSSTA